MRLNENRGPGSLRAHLPSRIPFVVVLSVLTLGVALTLIVVPGVPVVSSQEVVVLAFDDSPTEVTSQDQKLKLIEGWVRDLSDDSWAVRRVARQKLIEQGQRSVSSLEKALQSSDPEVREQAQSIIEELDKKKKQVKPVVQLDDGRGIVERRVIRLGPDRSIQIELDLDGANPAESKKPSLQIDPFETSREIEQEIKKLEQELLRGFPEAFLRRSILGRLGGVPGATNSWRGSTRFQVTRDGQVVVDSSTSNSTMTLEPTGLAFETLQPSLRAHLPSLPEGGFLLSRVREGSYAELVGLKKWDILVSLEGTPITSFDQVEKMLVDMPGDYQWSIIRGGQVTILEPKTDTNPKPKRF